MQPAVLMTDPTEFDIRGGANPHTREPDNTLKSVDKSRAKEQWDSYVDALLDGGVDVYVLDSKTDLTGMVFTANAGFLTERLEQKPARFKTFYPSQFTAEHRIPESSQYRDFMDNFGFDVKSLPENWRFEGEADAFPIGRGDNVQWIFTYGFRSDADVGNWLEEDVIGEQMLKMKLSDPSYYHGDCLICDLGGPLLAWKDGLKGDSAERLEETFSQRIIELSDEDAKAFIGNSFYVETDSDRLLFTPAEIRDEIRSKVEELGITVIPVDISEFFGKGGGGPKCMVFNLGLVDPNEAGLAPEARRFRHSRYVKSLRKDGEL